MFGWAAQRSKRRVRRFKKENLIGAPAQDTLHRQVGFIVPVENSLLQKTDFPRKANRTVEL
jgi:hypothetical protein